MKSTLLAILATGALGLTSCLSGGNQTCSQTATEPAISVTGPKTVAVNQAATFVINYVIQSPCGKSQGPSEQVQGNTRYVGVQVVYDGCNCPAQATPTQASYTFTPNKAGKYFLNFNTAGTNAFIMDTLVVK